MKYQRFIPLVIPLVAWLGSQIYLVRPEFFYIVLALVTLLIILSVRYLTLKNRDGWLLYAISPVLVFLGLASYITIIIGNFWIQTVLLAAAWYLFSYFKGLYLYINAEEGEIIDSQLAQLENLLIAGGFLVVFSTTGFWFGLPAFVSWLPLYSLPVVAIVILLLFVQFSLFSPNRDRPLGTTALLIVILLTESAWAFSLLPLHFNILAMFMAISYYFGFTILRLKWSGSLDWRSLKIPLLLSSLAMLSLFLTARWL